MVGRHGRSVSHGLSSIPSTTPDRRRYPHRPMKIGICGVAGFGIYFAELFDLHPQIESQVIADLNPAGRALADKLTRPTRTVETFDELLATDVDSIGIFTAPWTHATLAIRALEAGKHVFAACPAALTIAELRAVIDAVTRTGKIYMTAETGYYYSATMFAREAWQEGRFGDFVYGEGEYYYRPNAYPFWMRDFYGNMPPMLYATHSTPMVVSVTGKRIERVTCVGVPGLHADIAPLQRRPEWRDNQFSNMTMLGQMSGGGTCRINEMRNVGCRGELGSLIGTRGSLRQHSGQAQWSNGLDEDINLTALWQDPAHHPQTEPAAKLPAAFAGRGMEHDGSHRFLADEFIRAVTHNQRPHNHVWAAANYCAPGITAWESLQQNSAWLDVPDFGEPTDGREPLDY
jgi:predicted dehydrogenase